MTGKFAPGKASVTFLAGDVGESIPVAGEEVAEHDHRSPVGVAPQDVEAAQARGIGDAHEDAVADEEEVEPQQHVMLANRGVDETQPGMHDLLIQFIFKRAIMLIDIQVIIFMKVIADIQVRVAIQIDVGSCYAQAIADGRTIDV